MTDPLADLPVWLINLERAVSRRERMEAQLAALGLSYTRFAGVDGKAERERLLATVDIPAFERNMGRRILIGGIGCYHSHIAVWRAFLESGAPVALILEDDVVFHDDFRAALTVALEGQAHWDLLKLNRIRAKLPVPQGRLGTYVLNAYLGSCTGNGAYLIKRETAARLLPRMLPITRATDHEINRFFLHDFRLRGLEPFPSHVDDGNVSQITGTGFADVQKLPRLQRLPHYRVKAGNYARRFWWMLRHGELLPTRQQLPRVGDGTEHPA
ncbi:MAG: glycosyltransferase family 25 protein [Alkalilacustris sp.]